MGLVRSFLEPNGIDPMPDIYHIHKKECREKKKVHRCFL